MASSSWSHAAPGCSIASGRRFASGTTVAELRRRTSTGSVATSCFTQEASLDDGRLGDLHVPDLAGGAPAGECLDAESSAQCIGVSVPACAEGERRFDRAGSTGARLRIQDCLELRVKDVDFDRNQIVVRRGKGQKDRVTMLPVAVRERLRTHLSEVRQQHERDCARGVGHAVLPFALDRKYPTASTDWACQFVFPASRICRDARWGPPSRYHLHESVVQKAMTQAVRRAGLTKRVSAHSFRSVSA